MRIALLFLILVSCMVAQPIDETVEETVKSTDPEDVAKITTTTRDGMTIAYEILEKDSNERSVILLHMLGGSKEDWSEFGKKLFDKGFNVISIDFRGHGKSEGEYAKFTNDDYAKMFLDVEAARDVLAGKGLGTDNLVILGASIGANVGLNYAEKNNAGAVVLLSPGLDYKGVSIRDSSFKGKILAVASKEDKYSADTLKKIGYEQIMLENAGHGTEMLPYVQEEIINWIIKN